MKQTETYDYQRELICTVAVYGHEAPVFFKGSLILKKYYVNGSKSNVDQSRSEDYMLDTIYYETNKIVRMQKHEPYGDNRELVVCPFEILGDPYRIVYNKRTTPSLQYDDALVMLKDKDPDARGVAIVLKQDDKGHLTWLQEEEGRKVEQILSTVSY